MLRGKHRIIDVHQHLVCVGNLRTFIKQHIPVAVIILLPFDFIPIGLLPVNTQICRVLKLQILIYVFLAIQHTGLCAIVDTHIVVMYDAIQRGTFVDQCAPIAKQSDILIERQIFIDNFPIEINLIGMSGKMHRCTDSMPFTCGNRCGLLIVFQTVSNDFNQSCCLVNTLHVFVIAEVEQQHIRVRFFQIYILFQDKVLSAYHSSIVGIL